MFRWILLILFLAAVAVGLAIGALNPDPVSFDLLWWQLTLPLGALILTALAIGIVLGLAIALAVFVLPGRVPSRRRRKNETTGASLTDRSNA